MKSVTINYNHAVTTPYDFVTRMELQDADNIAKARVNYFRQVGWTQFTPEELLSEARLGISIAIVRFNPARGSVKDTKFTSYAYFWINKYIQEYIARNKSMLSGTLAECWRDEMPYTSSYDQFAADSDTAGLDHMKSLRDISDNIDEQLDKVAIQSRCKRMFGMVMQMLDPMESLVFKLNNGIGTISGEPMQIREIARSTEISAARVEDILNSVREKLHTIGENQELRKQFSNIYD